MYYKIPNHVSLLQVLGQGFSLKVLLENVKDHRPSSMVVGSHHYVQLSEFDLSTTKITCADLRSVKSITPSGAAVPSICRQDYLDIMSFTITCNWFVLYPVRSLVKYTQYPLVIVIYTFTGTN